MALSFSFQTNCKWRTENRIHNNDKDDDDVDVDADVEMMNASSN